MNRYVVAYWSDHTGELKQELVEAKTPLEAVLSYMQWDDPSLTNMDLVYNYAANCDCMVNVICVDKLYTRKTSIPFTPLYQATIQ